MKQVYGTPRGLVQIQRQIDLWTALLQYKLIPRDIIKVVLHMNPSRLDLIPHLGEPKAEGRISRPCRIGIIARIGVPVQHDHVDTPGPGSFDGI
jgi:hypothetical protein